MDKVRGWITRFFESIPRAAPEAAMKYIVWYAVFLVLCMLIYLAMILTDWAMTGRPNLLEMRQFISTMLSGAAVAAIGFISRWLVDTDHDGIPDEAEKGEK